jgi:hypothetical protein
MPYGVSTMNVRGKIEYGIDTNDGPRSRKMETTRLVGFIESGKHVNSRLKNLGSIRTRRRYVKAFSMLLVLFAAATVVVSALALTEASQASISAKQPPSPHTIYGFSWASDGVTPMLGSIVTVTNTRTGEFTTWNDTHEGWDPLSNIYNIDLSEMPTAWVVGDLFNVTSVNGVNIGWNESVVTDNAFDQIDVTLDGTPIPEFPMLILPVGGIIALFAVVSLRRKGKEQ